MNQGGEQIAGSNDASGGISSYVIAGIKRTSVFPLRVAGVLLSASTVGDGAYQLALGISDLLCSHEMGAGRWRRVIADTCFLRTDCKAFLLQHGIVLTV